MVSGRRNKDAQDDNESILKLDAKFVKHENTILDSISNTRSILDAKQLHGVDLRADLDACEGPCMEEYRAVCDEMKFERQVWHGGAPNGRDCHKAVQPRTIRRFMEVHMQIYATTVQVILVMVRS